MRHLIAVCCVLFSVHVAAEPWEEMAAEGAALIPPFQQQLLETVKAAMASGGPAKAVEACQLLAPGIASAHWRDGWAVGRTALKVRSPDNAPDAWERAVLERFAERAAAGEPLASMQQAEVVGGEVRLMKAIPTGEPCLACHGRKIEPALAALIDQRYPDDQARGFAVGDLRGAFTLRRPLESSVE
ncbi:Tll0287-like domain-containing protein [Pseudomonas indica]|uniref:Tll0287-like domain-containing protein n=1 Tax=Pseudomonas indica TaxID=137658 RepID=UPI000BABB32C|nr:DUF3365 domain-containing protein [Pseudomonas indica]MBU3055278.1 DUF3365 domain-containing protein [Pseudomonas indica]PAU52840.1 glutamate synthase [Pseudomonas indica]